MKIAPEKLKNHLVKELFPVYVISGDEPLLSQELADQVRLGARQNGFSSRDVFRCDNHFDWDQLHNENSALSLFSEKKIIELHLATSKPGDKGSKALQALCSNPNPDNLILSLIHI